MKKHYLLLLFMYFIYARETFVQGFRDFKWGTPLEQIIIKEGKPDNTFNRNSIAYINTEVPGNSATIGFVSLQKKGLQKGYYGINLKNNNAGKTIIKELIYTYGRTKKIINKYGVDEYHWTTPDTKIIFVYDPKHGHDLNYSSLTYYCLQYWNMLQKGIEVKKTRTL